MNTTDKDIQEILKKYKKFVVYGLSQDGTKPSQRVPLFMKSQGYDIVGIYPGQKEIAGFPIYQNLKEVPAEHRKFVDVFRRPEHIPQVVDEVIAVGGVEVLWLQLGITHPEAEKKAEAAGIKVVSNRCLHIEYDKWMR
ncbi:MAG: CoA-binding protein [Oligoflexia bacterium]|nr:MAG: CoA-binding protein [Oligoflexia bacterium]